MNVMISIINQNFIVKNVLISQAINVKKFTKKKKNHKNIIDINIIDDNCFLHNEKNILFCNNCEESLYNICIKSQNHKGHEICELKFLDLKKLKDKCIKFKKNLAKK